MKNFQALCTPDLVDLLHQLKMLLYKHSTIENNSIEMPYGDAIAHIQKELDSRKPPHASCTIFKHPQQHSITR